MTRSPPIRKRISVGLYNKELFRSRTYTGSQQDGFRFVVCRLKTESLRLEEPKIGKCGNSKQFSMMKSV